MNANKFLGDATMKNNRFFKYWFRGLLVLAVIICFMYALTAFFSIDDNLISSSLFCLLGVGLLIIGLTKILEKKILVQVRIKPIIALILKLLILLMIGYQSYLQYQSVEIYKSPELASTMLNITVYTTLIICAISIIVDVINLIRDDETT